MTHIGLLSDTHGTVDTRLYKFWENCDELWHAGDIGNLEVIDELKKFKPLKAVHGNIDNQEIRMLYPKEQFFNCEGMDVFITHIGGYPNNYAPGISNILLTRKPGLFIAGHSHILKVIFDKKMNLLFINPGAAGNSGFHKIKTGIRFSLENSKITNLEIWESPRG